MPDPRKLTQRVTNLTTKILIPTNLVPRTVPSNPRRPTQHLVPRPALPNPHPRPPLLNLHPRPALPHLHPRPLLSSPHPSTARPHLPLRLALANSAPRPLRSHLDPRTGPSHLRPSRATVVERLSHLAVLLAVPELA